MSTKKELKALREGCTALSFTLPFIDKKKKLRGSLVVRRVREIHAVHEIDSGKSEVI